MVANSIIVQQLMVLVLSGTGILVLGHQLLGGLGITSDVLAAFRLKILGQVGLYGGIGLSLFLLLSAVSAGSHGALLPTLFDVLLCAALMGLGNWALREYRGATLRALGKAEAMGQFEALAVYRAYATAFPNSPEPMTKLLSDVAGLRMLQSMHEEGVRFEGKPIPTKVGEWCMDARPDVIKTALDVGMFKGNDALEGVMRRRYREGVELEWEDILTRKPGSPAVGQVVRGMLEEAIARQDSRVEHAIGGVHLESEARLAMHNLAQRVGEHLARVRIDLIPELDDTETASAPPYKIVFEVVSASSHKLVYEDSKTTVHVSRAATSMHTSHGFTEHRVTMVQRESKYPLLSVRCSVMRNGSKLVSIDIDSAPGLEVVLKHNTAKMGGGPSQLAADVLMSSFIQGIGMAIGSPSRGQHRLGSSPSSPERTSAEVAVSHSPQGTERKT